MSGRVMIVDDEQAIRDSLRGLFEDEGYLVCCAASGEEAIAKLRNQSVDCVLLDIWMPGIDGLETLNRIHQLEAGLPVIMMSGHATIDTAVKATRQGAFDFLEKPLSSERLLILVRNAIQKRRLELENRDLKDTAQISHQELIGQSRAINEIRQQIRQIAQADSPVLILGEHGTGKAVAARMLHAGSRRARGPFVEINTAGIRKAHMDVELFGHEKGAFPGATRLLRGRLEMAHEGTLFVDEITELPNTSQGKLLRALKEHVICRQGGRQIPANVRLLAASSVASLEMLVKEGLREDLFDFLRPVTIQMPPLRQRQEDLPLLVEALCAELAESLSGSRVHFTEQAIARLQSYSWPGNVRELRNYIERTHILMPGEEITPENMLAPVQTTGMQLESSMLQMNVMAEPFHEAKREFERNYLLHYLQQHEWNISKTAAAIGMERSQLHRKIKAFGLQPPEKDET